MPTGRPPFATRRSPSAYGARGYRVGISPNRDNFRGTDRRRAARGGARQRRTPPERRAGGGADPVRRERRGVRAETDARLDADQRVGAGADAAVDALAAGQVPPPAP